MWWVSHIFDVACTWLKGLLKNDEEPPVLEERWSFQRCRGMDEAERSICGLESSVPTTDVGLASEWELRIPAQDRKSTRLNSSHQIISYAVFCLKKKMNKNKVSIKQILVVVVWT